MSWPLKLTRCKSLSWKFHKDLFTVMEERKKTQTLRVSWWYCHVVSEVCCGIRSFFCWATKLTKTKTFPHPEAKCSGFFSYTKMICQKVWFTFSVHFCHDLMQPRLTDRRFNPQRIHIFPFAVPCYFDCPFLHSSTKAGNRKLCKSKIT